MLSVKRVLYYPGAGWDLDYIKHFDYINKFILCDTLPSQKHYSKNQVGYKHQENFLDHLYKLYGKPIASNPRVNLTIYKLEDSREVYYYHNTNADIFPVPRETTDILIRGFIPSWYNEDLKMLSLHILWHSCDTSDNYMNIPMVCFCEEKNCRFLDYHSQP